MNFGWNTSNISIPQKFLRSQYLPPKQEFFSPFWPPFPPALVLQKTRLLDNFFWQFLSLNPLNCVVECGLLWCACSSGNWPNFSNWTIHIWPVWPHGSNMKKDSLWRNKMEKSETSAMFCTQIWPSFFNNALKLVGGRKVWFKINAYPLFLDTLAYQVSTTVSQ